MGGPVKGDIVVVLFSFSGLSSAKKRPALVLATPDGDDVILCLITSRLVSIRETDVTISKLIVMPPDLRCEVYEMRKIIVLTFVTLDGVMQAPGGPEEDPSGGFQYGGWTVPYFDEFLGNEMASQMGRPFDLLLGKKTYEIFAAYWPNVKTPGDPVSAGLNNATKYVVSKTLTNPVWGPSVVVRGDVVREIKQLKESDGADLQVHGSGNLIQTLLKNDLADELWLKIFPITLGPGKRLFADGTIPAAFRLLECKTSPKGVIIASYQRAGEVTTGSFGS
jgi:dihydrofolate reductase